MATVASTVTVDGCTAELRTSCSASGCGCLNGRCTGGSCPVLSDGCTGQQRNACSSFGCGCLNDHCSGGFCPTLSDGCSDETVKKCAAFGCNCSNNLCSGGPCPTLPDGCSESHRIGCGLSRCGCSNNQCSGGACPVIADGCEEPARKDCAGIGCGCWGGKCSGDACPSDLRAPGPPDSGPGSPKYPHKTYRLTRTGKTNVDSLIYAPSDPVPEKAPIVVMFHGVWPEARPELYEPFATHLARKGYKVILPLYGSTDGIHLPDIETYAKDARHAIAAARVDASGQLVFVGHAAGSMVALRLAEANPPEADGGKPIPTPKALVLHDPMGDEGAHAAKDWSPAGLTKIPAYVKLLIIASESSFKDKFRGTALIREAWQQMATASKNVWVLPSDRRCSPENASQCVDLERSTPSTDRNWSLVGRSAKVVGFAGGEHALNAIDWHGYWRLTEAALRTAFGQNPPGFDPFCRTKLDPKCNDLGRRSMGDWTLKSGKVPLPALLNADDAAVAAALGSPTDGAKPKAPSKAPH